ncbi:MAG TPA: hypothetical protein VLA88_02115 [Candidatus Saccharimonadales bacterium]|nr:hypothetical protein [Candidatus Saccharimonadales bacterium]
MKTHDAAIGGKPSTSQKADTANAGYPRFLAAASLIPAAATVAVLAGGTGSTVLPLVAVGLIPAVLNIFSIPVLLLRHRPALSVALVAALGVILSIAYVAWVGYIAYSITTSI